MFDVKDLKGSIKAKYDITTGRLEMQGKGYSTVVVLPPGTEIKIERAELPKAKQLA